MYIYYYYYFNTLSKINSFIMIAIAGREDAEERRKN